MDQSEIPSTSGTENVNSSNPFGYLESSVSSEQLQTWQQMNEKVKSRKYITLVLKVLITGVVVQSVVYQHLYSLAV